MINKNAVDKIEAIFLRELGSGSKFILEQNLRDLGLSRETFKKSDIKRFVAHLIKEYNKLLGKHVFILEKEISKKFN
jgi:hypothetical protein